MALPPNPLGGVLTGKLSTVKAALPPNPLKGLVSPGVTPVPNVAAPPSHTLAPGGLEQLQHQTEAASAPAVSDFNRRAGTTYGDIPAGWKPEDIRAIREMAAKNPQVAAAWGALVNPIEWGKQAVHGAEQLGHVPGDVARGHLGKAGIDLGEGGLAAASVLPMEKGLTALRDAGGLEHLVAVGHAISDTGKAAAENARLVHAVYGESGEIRPFHGFSSNKTAKNLMGKLNPRTQKSGLTVNEPVLTKEGIHAYGHITPDQWVQRVVKMLPQLETRDAAARWYESFEPLFRRHFPPDVADKIMRAFAVSQANASPVGGLASSVLAHERMSAGEDVGSIGSVVADNIEKALRGEHIDSHVAAKLSDFIDALRGEQTRTWMGHDPRGGAPAPIDIWGQRDLGHVDNKLLSKHVPAYVERTHGVDITKAELTPAGASGSRYERLAEKYHEITDHLNATGFDGRHDWTPAQVQALGWHSIQRFYGRNPQSLEEALLQGPVRAKAMAARQAFGKAVEGTREPDGGFTLHGDLSPDLSKEGHVVALAPYEKRVPAADLTEKVVRDYAREHKALLRNPRLRVGAWHNPEDGQVYLDISRVLPTREEAMAFGREHGQLSAFDRAAADRGDFADAFPKTGLSEEEADAIKTAARIKVQAPQRFNTLLENFARQEFGRTGKITPLDRQYAEQALHGWADAHPNEPLAQQFKRLASDAHDTKATEMPEPEDVFGRVGDTLRGVGHALSGESGQVDLGAIRDAISPQAVRTPEEAQSHLLEAASQARAEGFGGGVGGKGNPPLIEKGVATPETGGELGQKIREALPHAPSVRSAQKAGFSEERTNRVRAAADAALKAGGGLTGHIAGKRHLADELPREFFGHWKDLTRDDLHQLALVVDKAPLQYFERTHVIDALMNAVDHGVVPTKGDQALIERVFGRVAGTAAPDEKVASFWDKFVGALNIPRAVRSSGDISAGFRQGLVVLVTHPNVFRRQWVKQIRSFGSEEFYQSEMAAIHNDPLYPLMHKYGLPLTEIGGNVPGQEEAFVGAQAAEHIPLGVGRVVRMSDRAFTGFQNGTRAELFKIMAEKAASLGHNFTSDNAEADDLGQSIARVVGTFTGRGTVPKALEGHLTTMNALMFSPRLMAARMNLLSPAYYAKLDPFARREALAGARNVVAAIGATMFVAKLLGAQVTFDPRSSNFAKVKVGNTRIDIAGGFSQYVRFIAQEMTREAISSAGHHAHIGHGQHDISDLANATKLFRSKAAPIPSLLWDEASGKDFIGQPVKQGHELWSNAPFVAQDSVDAYQKSGAASVPIAAFLSAIGLGVQSYKDKPQGRPTPRGGGAGLPSLPPLPALPALPRTP